MNSHFVHIIDELQQSCIGGLQLQNFKLTHIVIMVNVVSILRHVPWGGCLRSWEGPGGLQGGACDGRVLQKSA